MRIQSILAFAVLCLAVRAASQDAPKLPTHVQCKFSDGTKTGVYYSNWLKTYVFLTNGSLVAIKGARVPSGNYAISPAKDEDNNWTLRMIKQVLKIGDRKLPPLAISVAKKALPVDSLPIVFDQTGGSCMMYWKQGDSVPLLSLEFTRENTDMPVSD